MVLRISDDAADGDTDRLASRVAGSLTLHAHCSVKVHESEHAARVHVSLNEPLYYRVPDGGTHGYSLDHDGHRAS